MCTCSRNWFRGGFVGVALTVSSMCILLWCDVCLFKVSDVWCKNILEKKQDSQVAFKTVRCGMILQALFSDM